MLADCESELDKLDTDADVFRVRIGEEKAVRLWVKGLIFYCVLFSGFVIGASFLPERVAPLFGVLWMFVFGISAFVFFRCPACGKSAFRTPSGWRVPWTGLKCRYCGKDY